MKLGFIKLPPGAARKHLVVLELANPTAARARLVIATVSGAAVWLLSRVSRVVFEFNWPWAVEFVTGFGSLLLLALIVKIDNTARAEKETQETDKNERRPEAG